MADEDPQYIAWLSEQLCCMCGKRRSGPPHHRKHYSGGSMRMHDHEAMPLCVTCHTHRHALSGPFKGWVKLQIRLWERAQVELYRALWFRRGGVADGGSTPGTDEQCF